MRVYPVVFFLTVAVDLIPAQIVAANNEREINRLSVFSNVDNQRLAKHSGSEFGGHCTALKVADTIRPPVASSPQPDAVDEFVKGYLRDMQVPGLALAGLKDGQVIKMSAYGQANLEMGTPVTLESVFMIASLSKQFISVTILLLQQDGKLALDDKVSRYIDGLPDTWKDISLRQLLTHTSGISRDPSDYHPYTEQPVSDVIRSMYAMPLNALPGEKWLYSNVGYFVLAEVTTRVSGKPWDTFIAERIFAPAGLTSTRTSSTKDIIPHRVSGFHRTPDGLINAENWIAVRPSGAFLSTIKDLAKWDAFLDKGSLLTASNRQLKWTPGTLNDKTPVIYGLGWYVESFLGRARLHHDGQFPGFRADYERFSDGHLTVIILANLDNSRIESLAIKVAGFYQFALKTPPFSISVKTAPDAVPSGSPIAIKITARDGRQTIRGR